MSRPKIENKKKINWTSELVDREKQAIKQLLDKFEEEYGIEGRLDFILEQMGFLEEQDSPEAHLRRVLFGISALVHHSRHEGLEEGQVAKIKKLVTGILRDCGIAPQKSRISVLYGDLYLALAQINYKAGAHWAALLEQNTAYQLANAAKPGGEAFQARTVGARSLRLGNSSLAIKHFELAEKGELTLEQREIARLARIKALRLSGKREQAEALALDTETNFKLSESGMKELKWEKVCLACQQTGNLKEMLRSVKTGDHQDPGYVVEAFFWNLAFSGRMESKLPSMRSVGKKIKIDSKGGGLFLECAKVLESCYDTEASFFERLDTLGEMISRFGQLITIDKEMLVWIACARWFSQNNNLNLAALCLSEYRKLSYSLTDGKMDDAMGLVRDLFDRGWFNAA